MSEKFFKRPTNLLLSERKQWGIDSNLCILDWIGDLSKKETKRFKAHYK